MTRLNRNYLGLPFPLKNHFYKWKAYSFYKGWYCKNCHNFFEIEHLPKTTTLSEISCTHCKSTQIYQSTELFRAWVDNYSKKDIEKLLSQIDNMAGNTSNL